MRRILLSLLLAIGVLFTSAGIGMVATGTEDGWLVLAPPMALWRERAVGEAASHPVDHRDA